MRKRSTDRLDRPGTACSNSGTRVHMVRARRDGDLIHWTRCGSVALSPLDRNAIISERQLCKRCLRGLYADRVPTPEELDIAIVTT